EPAASAPAMEDRAVGGVAVDGSLVGSLVGCWADCVDGGVGVVTDVGVATGSPPLSNCGSGAAWLAGTAGLGGTAAGAGSTGVCWDAGASARRGSSAGGAASGCTGAAGGGDFFLK